LFLDAEAATFKAVAVLENLKNIFFLLEELGNIIKKILSLCFFRNMHLIKINLCAEVAAFFHSMGKIIW